MLYKLFLDEDNYLQGFVHTGTSEDTFEMDATLLELDYLNCYKCDGIKLVLDEEKKAEAIRKEEEAEEEAKLNAEKDQMLRDMLVITREKSDKVGYDFEIYTLGNVELKRVYVKSEDHSGTIDDPIPFELGLTLIPNAFYSYDNHLWVYMGASGVVAEKYPVDGEDGWAFWE